MLLDKTLMHNTIICNTICEVGNNDPMLTFSERLVYSIVKSHIIMYWDGMGWGSEDQNIYSSRSVTNEMVRPLIVNKIDNLGV